MRRRAPCPAVPPPTKDTTHSLLFLISLQSPGDKSGRPGTRVRLEAPAKSSQRLLRRRSVTGARRRLLGGQPLLRAAGPRPVGRAERSDGLQEGCLSAQRSCVRPALLRRCTAGGFPCGCMAPAALLLRVVRRCARWHCFAYCAFYIFTRGLIETIITI